ncbi:MAG: hypothetical protein ACTS5A_00975 [Candidatus Hodgkinia cicadicola]
MREANLKVKAHNIEGKSKVVERYVSLFNVWCLKIQLNRAEVTLKLSNLRFSWLRRRIRPVEWTIDELNQPNEHAKTLSNTSFDWEPLPW